METTQMMESALCPYCLELSATLASFVNATSSIALRSTTTADSGTTPRGRISKTRPVNRIASTAKTCDLCWLVWRTLFRNSIFQTLLRSAGSQVRRVGDQVIAEYDENGISDADEPNENKFDIDVVPKQDDLPQEGLCELAVTFLVTIKDRFRKASAVEIHESLPISVSVESPNVHVRPDRSLSWTQRLEGLSGLIRLAPGPAAERWPVERLPARFIEITASDPVPYLSARLVAVPIWYQENSEGNPDFVALSHRWGDMGNSMTTTNNVAERMGGLSVGELPQTFVDACRLTRLLGLKYLWIDALCIIQDSRNDWATESLKMGDVFRSAHVVLAAHSARDSSQGFLVNTLWPPTRVVRLPTRPVISLRLRPNFETEVARSHLSQRGWVMQERLLATRTLHFTEGHIFLESPTDIWAEGDLDVPGVKYNAPRSVDDIKEASRLLYSNAFSGTATTSGSKQQDPWATLVEWYSVCGLTREEDKLVAIHGIATLIQRTRDCLYFSGLWSDNFHTGLLWLRRAEELTFPNKRRAPSWSWASVEGPLQYYCDDDSSLQPAYTSIAPSSDGTAPVVLGKPTSQLSADGLEPAATWLQSSRYLTITTETVYITEHLRQHNPRKKKPLWLWPRSKADPPTGWSEVMPNLQYPVPVFPILEFADDATTWTASRLTRPVLTRHRPPYKILGWVTLDSYGSRGEGEGDVEKMLDDWVGKVLFARIARSEGGMALGLLLAPSNGLEYTRIGFGQLVEEHFGWQPEVLTVV